MEKITIGNDIKLKVTLTSVFGVTNKMDIKQGRCFLINKTLQQQNSCATCNTAYTLDSCCVPCYYSFPHRHYSSHWYILPYNGFGYTPDFRCIYNRCNRIGCCTHSCNYEVELPVQFTEQENVVIIDYPACKQRFTGVYDLKFVFEIYVRGYNDRNVKTITVDCMDAFELVSEGGKCGIIEVEFVNSEPGGDGGSGTDNYVVNGSFDYETNQTDNNPKLTLQMNTGDNVVIDMADLAWGYPDKESTGGNEIQG